MANNNQRVNNNNRLQNQNNYRNRNRNANGVNGNGLNTEFAAEYHADDIRNNAQNNADC